MLPFAIISIFIFTIGTWGILSGSLYRKPLYLCIFGLFLALAGGYMAYIFDLSSQNSDMVKIFENLKLASTLISYTVAAAGGSLIASGIVLKAQHLAKRDSATAKNDIHIIINELNSIKNAAHKIIKNENKQEAKQLEEKLLNLRLYLSRIELRLSKAVTTIKELET
jgi:hypothetical protein